MISKKLTNNGLWESSRMMLPQHREAIVQRQLGEAQHTPERPKREDLELMRDSILLPALHALVTKRIQEMERSTETLRTLYVKVAYLVARHIYDDLSKLKKRMRDQDMHVIDEVKDESSIQCTYVCRGYEDAFVMTKESMRMEMSVRLRRYTEHMVARLK